MPVEVKALYSQYPTQAREEVCKSLADAVQSSGQSLVLVDKQYGEGVTELWLVVQLVEVIRYTNLLDKFKPYQLEATAKQLREQGYFVTMPEFMMFFQRFEQGYYETFKGYERPNPQVITHSFKIFLNDLLSIRQHVDEKQRSDEQSIREAQWKANAVPCPPHIREKLERLYKNFGK